MNPITPADIHDLREERDDAEFCALLAYPLSWTPPHIPASVAYSERVEEVRRQGKGTQ